MRNEIKLISVGVGEGQGRVVSASSWKGLKMFFQSLFSVRININEDFFYIYEIKTDLLSI